MRAFLTVKCSNELNVALIQILYYDEEFKQLYYTTVLPTIFQAIVKACEGLSVSGKIKEKVYGKQKVYVADQSQFPDVSLCS